MSEVCRTCTQPLSNEYFYLDGSILGSSKLLLKDVLQSCIPEVAIDLIPNSAVCKNCMSTIGIIYQFKTETIKNQQVFCRKENINVKNFEPLKNSASGDEDQSSNAVVDYTSLTASDRDNDDRDTNDRAYEIEFDDLDQLKAEIIYEEDIEDEHVIEITVPDDIESIEDSRENSNDQVVQEETKVFEGQPLEELPIQSESNNISIKQESELDVDKFIQLTRDRKMRRNIKRPYKCTECDFCSDAKASLEMHKRIHTGETPFHCTKCIYKAKRKSHLEDHMKTHTGERPFKCTRCNKRFITKHLLNKHTLIHTGEKPYRCLQCNFIARHKSTIANHVKRVHIGIIQKYRVYVCHVCGKSLSGSTSLKTHMKIHTGVKSHLCEWCGRYFREKGMLKNHLQVHTGEKPFTCTECNYTATRKAHLQDHLRTHTDQRQLIQCTKCEKRYTTKILLRKHMKDDHQENIKQEPPIFTASF